MMINIFQILSFIYLIQEWFMIFNERFNRQLLNSIPIPIFSLLLLCIPKIAFLSLKNSRFFSSLSLALKLASSTRTIFALTYPSSARNCTTSLNSSFLILESAGLSRSETCITLSNILKYVHEGHDWHYELFNVEPIMIALEINASHGRATEEPCFFNASIPTIPAISTKPADRQLNFKFLARWWAIMGLYRYSALLW